MNSFLATVIKHCPVSYHGSRNCVGSWFFWISQSDFCRQILF